MTIEEFIAQQLQDNPDPDKIIFIGFKASESRVWSECTAEDFSCEAYFDRKDEPAANHGREHWSLYLSERDVVKMLNTMFPIPK